MTSVEFKQHRTALGLPQAEFAQLLGLGPNGKRTIQRIEAGANVTGPMALAVERLLDIHTR